MDKRVSYGVLYIKSSEGSIIHTETIRLGSAWGARRVTKAAAKLFASGMTASVNGEPRTIVEKNGRFYTRIPSD